MQQISQSQKAGPDREQSRTERAREAELGRKNSSEHSPALALQALLAGLDTGNIPAADALSLSRRIGNSALLDLMARRSAAGPETLPYRVPGPTPETAPAAAPEGTAETVSAPDFVGFAALPPGPALAV